jgi:hypothetical protein
VRLKFHQTLPSQAAGYPFVAGQVIDLPRGTKLTAEQKDWIARGWVEVLKDEPERAVVPDRHAHAVLGRK